MSDGLVFAGDDSYARGLAVVICSALRHLKAGPDIYVLDTGLSPSSRARIEKVIVACGHSKRLRWIPMPDHIVRDLPAVSDRGYLSPAAYAPLLIPSLLPDHVDRAVYLDADMLVRQDVSSLFNIELRDAPLGAAWTFSPYNAPPEEMFNTGMLIMDLPMWRSTDLADRALRFAALAPEPLLLADQDALNATVEKWLEVDTHWNLQHTLLFDSPLPDDACERFTVYHGRRRELYRSAAILHFVGTKPWHNWCTTPGTASWARELLRSRWYSPSEAMRWLLPWVGRRAYRRLITAGARLRRVRVPIP